MQPATAGKIALAALCLAGSIPGVTAPGADAPSAADAALLKAEDALFAADVNRDVAAVERGFASEAVFVHANGTIQTKADYIRAMQNSKMAPKSVLGTDRVVRIFGKVGVVRGTKTLEVGDLHLSGTYLTVYVMRDGRWQMLDEQSAPAPRATEPATDHE